MLDAVKVTEMYWGCAQWRTAQAPRGLLQKTAVDGWTIRYFLSRSSVIWSWVGGTSTKYISDHPRYLVCLLVDDGLDPR
jgi:hypothetical protein